MAAVESGAWRTPTPTGGRLSSRSAPSSDRPLTECVTPSGSCTAPSTGRHWWHRSGNSCKNSERPRRTCGTQSSRIGRTRALHRHTARKNSTTGWRLSGEITEPKPDNLQAPFSEVSDVPPTRPFRRGVTLIEIADLELPLVIGAGRLRALEINE